MAFKLVNVFPVNMLPVLHAALRVMGVVPESSAGLCYSAFISAFMLFNATPAMIILYLKRHDLTFVITNFGINLILFGAFLGHLFMLLRSRSLKSVIKQTVADGSVTSRESAVRHLRKSHSIMIGFSVVISSTMVMYGLEPLVNRSGELVIPGWYPFSTEDTVLYTLTFIYQLVTACFSGFFILAANLIFCEVSLHTYVHLESLSLSIQEAIMPEKYSSDVDMEKEMNVRVYDCVKRHINLLRRIKELSESVETAACVDYTFCIIATATVALQTIIMVENVSILQQVKSGLLLLCATLVIFPPCLIAHQTLEMQSKVGDITFDHNVIKAPDSVRRTLCIMQIRSQEQISMIKLFGFVDVHLVTYADALKMAYGIFTLLLHFKENKKGIK